MQKKSLEGLTFKVVGLISYKWPQAKYVEVQMVQMWTDARRKIENVLSKLFSVDPDKSFHYIIRWVFKVFDGAYFSWA
jgi:hypothetical protein